MLTVDNRLILEQTRMIEKNFKAGATAPLLFGNFLKTTLPKITPEFVPYEVKIPKSPDRLIKGDFEPARIIHINEPILWEGIPIWQKCSQYGIDITGFGYKNGDSRYPSTQQFNDKDIHGMMVGVTGHGKSVTINSIEFGIMFEYAPWEVELILADAKIVEFRRYATNTPPHVSAIAATDDPDYIISVLQNGYDQMKLRQAYFSSAGVQNIMDFREKTGLAIPRVLITIDEFQTMEKDAGKKASKIHELVDGYARLGRNAGYHLELCSQESGDMPAKTMGNIAIRQSLGAQAGTSTKILGNDEAKINFGTKGKLIVNTNAPNESKMDNVHYRVPFQSSAEFEEMKTFLHDLGERMNFKYPLSAYDGTTYKDEQAYLESLRTKRSLSPTNILLGEPSFVMDDPSGDNMVNINTSGSQIENIVIYCGEPNSLTRFARMITRNFSVLGKNVHNFVFTTDKAQSDDMGFEDCTAQVFETRGAEDKVYKAYVSTIYKKLVALEADKVVFEGEGVKEIPAIVGIYNRLVPEGSKLRSDVNMKRTHALLQLMVSPGYVEPLGVPSNYGAVDMQPESLIKNCGELIVAILQLYDSVGCASRQLLRSDLAPMYFWIIGLDGFLGIGRDGKSKPKQFLKNAMMDCARVNIRFICTLMDPSEMHEFKVAFRYQILDKLTETAATKMGAPEYPNQVGDKLSVLVDRYGKSKEPVKFKKMAFMDEVL